MHEWYIVVVQMVIRYSKLSAKYRQQAPFPGTDFLVENCQHYGSNVCPPYMSAQSQIVREFGQWEFGVYQVLSLCSSRSPDRCKHGARQYCRDEESESGIKGASL